MLYPVGIPFLPRLMLRAAPFLPLLLPLVLKVELRGEEDEEGKGHPEEPIGGIEVEGDDTDPGNGGDHLPLHVLEVDYPVEAVVRISSRPYLPRVLIDLDDPVAVSPRSSSRKRMTSYTSSSSKEEGILAITTSFFR